MVTLSLAHYIFIFMTILILVFLIFKKEIVIPCVVGILLIGFAYTGNVVSSVQILNNAIIASNGELFGIMLVIALVTALSKAMHTVGIDELMIRPVRKIIRKPSGAFWGIGLCMLIVSWLIWPSPAVVLIGALLLPVGGRVGLPAIWAAVAMNIFGHGMGLSSDFFIQGAPAITAASAELPVTSVISASVPLWLVMSITAAAVSFFMMKREMKKNLLKNEPEITADYAVSEMKRPVLSRILAVVVTATFAAIIIAMVTMDIQGGDATALVAGAALILTCIITIAGSGFREMCIRDSDQPVRLKIIHPLVRRPENVFPNSRSSGYFRQNLMVIQRNSQLFGKKKAELAASCSVLAADCYDVNLLLHSAPFPAPPSSRHKILRRLLLRVKYSQPASLLPPAADLFRIRAVTADFLHSLKIHGTGEGILSGTSLLGFHFFFHIGDGISDQGAFRQGQRLLAFRVLNGVVSGQNARHNRFRMANQQARLLSGAEQILSLIHI